MRRIVILVVAGLGLLAAGVGWLHHHTTRYDGIIRQAADRNGLDFYLVKAVIFEESWFRSDIRGSAGELGLMQITRAAASDFATKKGFPPFSGDRLIEPELNIEIGCWYLERSLEHYKNSSQPTLFALLRYNAGETRADYWLKRAQSAPPPAGVSAEHHYLSLVDYPKTRAYAQRILHRSRTRNFWF
jgi:soluble lytic murein transglycosylase